MKTKGRISIGACCAMLAVALVEAGVGAARVGAAPDYTLIARMHAEGTQVYECGADDVGALRWQFKEPVATLFQDGNPVGRHYAGPSWELYDGSIVVGRVTARAPSATPADIPHLWLEAKANGNRGRLATVSVVERMNTKGGIATGPCLRSGERLSVPYSADYAFLR